MLCAWPKFPFQIVLAFFTTGRPAESLGSRPTLLIIETGLTLITVVLAFCAPRAGTRFFAELERFFLRLARRQGLSVLAVGLAAGILRLAILPALPIPHPYTHDEFSFLLAADTFASGRLTNPTHPIWVYFESFHIEHVPTYMSMYFPAQGLVLALGQVLLGHPWYGVWFSAAIMCSAICWMLQGWLPPGWALLGGFLAVLRLALFSYWGNAYHGGAVAAIGGALVLGGVPRLRRAFRADHALVMALGFAILAISRPYEGLLVSLPAVFAVALRYWRLPQVHSIQVLRRIAPAAVVLLATAGFMAYYNHRVFGNPLTMPYEVNRATYMPAPQFVWQSAHPEPIYHHAVMRDFYVNVELADFLRFQTVSGVLSRTARKLAVILLFFFGIALIPPLMMLPRVIRDRRMRLLVITGSIFGLGLVLNAWLFPHYAAPFTAGFYVVLLQCMRHLRLSSPSGLAIMRFTPILCLALAGLRLCANPLNVAVEQSPAMWYGTPVLGVPRADALAELERHPGPQLAIVRYAAGHPAANEWVYNTADIDHAKVVWAREMDPISNHKLLGYFKNRQAWLVQPDFDPPKISPYKVPDSVISACSRPHR